MSGELKLHQAAPSPRGPEHAIPAIIADAGEGAARRFVEFFTANIRNPNTRRAYARAVAQFLRWCEARGFTAPGHRAHRRRRLRRGAAAARLAPPSVKQHLAAIRMLFDWLVTGQVVPVNPAASVAGPKHVVKKGKTPVLSADEARKLLDSHRHGRRVVGLRDRALIAVDGLQLRPHRGRASAMRVEDYYPKGKRWWLRLHEKGGKFHEVPAHHNAEEYLDAYIEAAGIADDRKGPLFRTAPRRRRELTANADADGTTPGAWSSGGPKPRASETAIGCHTLPGHRHHDYLENGGTLEKAQQMAAHESPKTTKLYDRTSDQITLDEVERIAI